MSSMMKVEEIRLTVPWGHIAGKSWGSSDATRVLVVHGTLDNAGSFDRLIPLLPQSFHYVAIDLPGHGFSSPLPPGIQLDYFNYVLAIRLVLDALKWDNCIYMGHSFGAQLGFFTSILYPNRITRLICIDGFIPTVVTNDEFLEKIRALQDTAVQSTNTAKSAPLYTKDEILYALKNKRNFPLNSPAAEALFVRGTTKVGDLYKFNRDFRLRTLLNPLFGARRYADMIIHLKIPVLVIVAESTWFHGPFSIKMLEAIMKNVKSNYTIARVRGNHDVHNNNPEYVAPHVSAFLIGAGKSKL